MFKVLDRSSLLSFGIRIDSFDACRFALGVRIGGLGFGVWDLKFRVQGLGLKV